MKYLLQNTFLLFSLLIINYSLISQPYGELIGDRTVAFYPQNFVPAETLPSMALLSEPDSIGEVPDNWTVFPDFFVEDEKNCATIDIEAGTDLYGTGEVVGDLRRNNTEVILWNTDNYGYFTDNGKRLYQSHPWILALRADGSSYGILVDHTWKQSFFLDDPIKIVSEGPPFRIIIIERGSPREVITALAELTGTIEMPPLWALGYHQCRYSYYPASQVREIAETFREKEIPCDVIWMDIDYMDGFRVFTFDPAGFPDPEGLNNYLHSLDFHSIWMIDPGIKQDPGYFVYDQGTAGDHWVLDADSNTYIGDVWPGPCAFPDYTMPETRQWWGTLYPDFMATGIDGVWNDMNEPAVFNGPDKTMPVDNIHRGGGELPPGPHLRYHNVYGMLMIKATREGVLQSNPDKRPFVLTRANFLGGQRYAATWTGDNISSWEHMVMSIPMSLNLGLSGQPFNGPDIGGFVGSPGADLLGHWMALGAFYPFARNHTATGTDQQEPWAYGPVIEQVSRTALQRRYRLLPYLYTLFREASVNGMPVMRPLFFADPANPALRDEQYSFLLGEDLMVIPSWTGTPVLPEGNWRDVYLLDELLENDGYQPALKQREGSVMPLAELAQSTESYSSDSITLLIATDGSGEALGELYADAGDGFGYLSGEYLETSFTVVPAPDDSLLVSCLTTGGSMSAEERHYRAGMVTSYGIFYSGWKNDSVFKIPYLPDMSVSIDSPQNGEVFDEGSDILLSADISGELKIDKVSFYSEITGLIGEKTQEPWEFTWQEVGKGFHMLYCVASTEIGIDIRSEMVVVQVGEFGEGSITWQKWNDIGGGVFVSDLTSQADYPDNPDESFTIDFFSTPMNTGDEYGSRIIGYLHPPFSGNFSFWITGDDYCELWLSADSTMANSELIAEVPGWTLPNEWTKYPEQHSEEIWLEVDQKYFIMALQKEAYNDDFIRVAWDFAGFPRQVIEGIFLSPYDFPFGTEEVSLSPSRLLVYPNPASKTVTIMKGRGYGELTLYTLEGKPVFNKTVPRSKEAIQIDLAPFENGIYLVRFTGSEYTQTVRLIIIN